MTDIEFLAALKRLCMKRTACHGCPLSEDGRSCMADPTEDAFDAEKAARIVSEWAEKEADDG